jgi:benzodiazapine receptor
LSERNNNLLRFGNIAAFALMITINGLAGTTVLNGRTTAQVSDIYSNPFTPAGYVFAIWGIIYALLSVFVIYQALPKQNSKLFQKKVGVLFIISSILNVVWLFLWQYDYITSSVIVMFALFVTLSAIYVRLGIGKLKSPLKEKMLVHLPFSVYLGWITVASIANVAAALVSVGWDGLGLGAETWAIIAMGIALIVSLTAITFRKDIAYALVVIWAFAGIAVEQSMYPTIVLIAQEAIVVILVALALSLLAVRLRHQTVPGPFMRDEELSITQTKHS